MGGESPGELSVLVLAPTGRDSSLITALLGKARVRTLEAGSSADAASEIRRGVGALVLCDEVLAGRDAVTIVDALHRQPPWSDLPVILLTSGAGEPLQTNSAFEALGNMTLLERPVGQRPFLSAVESALRQRERQYELREHFLNLSQVESDLRRANGSKDELLALVSHELRTPLTTVLGSAELLVARRDQLETEDRDELLRSIRDSGLRLQRLIENMLVLSRAELEEESAFEPVLLQRELLRMQAEVESSDTDNEIVYKIEASAPPVLGNVVFVHQIVENLVRNALKYGKQGSPIVVSLTSTATHVSLKVKSEGRRFDPPEAEQLFEPFFRSADMAATVPGMGLGLAVCRRLAEVQGASIRAVPRAAGGLVVELQFPAMAVDQA